MRRAAEVLLQLGQRPDGSPLEVPLAAFEMHAQFLGPTGYGKSRGVARVVQELVQKTRDATVVIDPAGDLSNLLRRWAYGRGFQHRVLFIDPRERRMVVGLNPIRPWTENRGLQAGVVRDIVRHALGSHETSASAPLAAQWTYNLIFALLECGLTMAEIAPLVDFTNPAFRNAVVGHLGPSVVRSEFETLAAVLDRSDRAQAMRFATEQLGSTTRRLRQFVTNDYLLPMLAGQANAIDWNWVIDQGLLVLVNLSLEGNALTEEDQRLIGQLMVSSLIRTSFARPEHLRRPVNLIIDEAGKFASPEVATILREGRKFRLRLLLAHQELSQLVRPADNDTSLLDAVVNNARLKVVFGGLGPRDANFMGQTLFGHLGDPDLRKLELRSPMQLSRVVASVSRTSAVSDARGRQFVRARSSSTTDVDAYGTSHSDGAVSSSSAGEMHTLGHTYAGDEPGQFELYLAEGAGSYSGSASAASSGDGYSEIHSSAQSVSQSEAEGHSRVSTRSRSITEGQMVVPGEPFEVLNGVQFESLEEQLHRHVSRMIRQPDRHALLAWGKSPPIEFVFAEVPEPKITLTQAGVLDLRVMRRLPCFAEPKRILEEMAARQRALLRPAAIEVIDASSAIERRRAARRGRAAAATPKLLKEAT